LHGDHFYGLIGLLSTYGILSREKELYIFGPKGIKKAILLLLNVSQSHLKYTLIFHELTSKKSELIFEDDKVSVFTIPLNHRVYCNGYLFIEKEKPRKLHMDNINNYKEISRADYLNIKAGKDITLSTGEIITNYELTIAPKRPLSFAFCSDTAYKPEISSIIKNVDILYHEATFLSDREDLAFKTKHSTSKQAAQLAKDANAKRLILGHYSSRYKDISKFESEAKEIFNNTVLALPGKIFLLD
jgi:ribonuclease Z